MAEHLGCEVPTGRVAADDEVLWRDAGSQEVIDSRHGLLQLRRVSGTRAEGVLQDRDGDLIPVGIAGLAVDVAFPAPGEVARGQRGDVPTAVEEEYELGGFLAVAEPHDASAAAAGCDMVGIGPGAEGLDVLVQSAEGGGVGVLGLFGFLLCEPGRVNLQGRSGEELDLTWLEAAQNDAVGCGQEPESQRDASADSVR